MIQKLRWLFILIALAFSKTLLAQPGTDSTFYLQENQTYQELFDSLTSGLIRARIPNGMLYNRVVHWQDPVTWQNGDTVTKYRLYQHL
jgi:hypothetical protein